MKKKMLTNNKKQMTCPKHFNPLHYVLSGKPSKPSYMQSTAAWNNWLHDNHQGSSENICSSLDLTFMSECDLQEPRRQLKVQAKATLECPY